MNESTTLDWLVDQVMKVLEQQQAQATAPEESSTISESITAQDFRSTQIDIMDTYSRVEELPPSLTDPIQHSNVPEPKWAEGMEELLASTPARIGVWRTGTRPLTSTMLALRNAHAAAIDAVFSEVSPALLQEMNLFTVETHYENMETFLRRPDKGRLITDSGVALMKDKCILKPQVQVVIADGLSANAIESNLKDVYPALMNALKVYGLSCGTPFFVKGGRVGCMDHIGEILQPEVLVLLIGERPGLVSSESMSAYMCYRPHVGTVESDRTVISNIHRGGTPPIEAGAHMGTVLHKMLEQQASGVKLVM
ncbi:ethanolamine ammonia-lyase [Paenibacillus selenitireducens]|uniref:Ethanolamine ammonia-lyase small subunit n=1 Tax=Paenibacillus selenitireducens TaxID=1324314 RepID=A0A1T2XK88_9BACL|nr:ethanolamine ammonia-lyase subunit EutC [Paenibacillus selenitireducens]OPA80281.1 ethanolamine ammonia-lyase [Paenibacillus selenitireducens]